MDKGEGIN